MIDLLIRLIDMCGCLLDILAVAAWMAYAIARVNAAPYHRAYRDALKKEVEPPPPDNWARIADLLFYVAVGCTLFWVMRMGRLQQAPVRG